MVKETYKDVFFRIGGEVVPKASSHFRLSTANRSLIILYLRNHNTLP
jgi:hypothetical protein